MILKYIILSAPASTMLEKSVQDFIRQGYEPIGGLALNPGLNSEYPIFYQAMVKRQVISSSIMRRWSHQYADDREGLFKLFQRVLGDNLLTYDTEDSEETDASTSEDN